MRMKTDMRVLLSVAAVIILLGSGLLIQKSLSLKKEGAALRSQQEELLLLRADFLDLRDRTASVEGKTSLTKVSGIVQAADEIFSSLGLNQKLKSVKPAGAREMKYTLEEEAEVQLEKLNMNEMINLLYKLENAPIALLIKKFSAKTAFDNPSLVNITVTLSLVRKK